MTLTTCRWGALQEQGGSTNERGRMEKGTGGKERRMGFQRYGSESESSKPGDCLQFHASAWYRKAAGGGGWGGTKTKKKKKQGYYDSGKVGG